MKLRNWNQLLWKYLIDSYCTGGPVYLSYNISVLRDILNVEFSTSFTQKEAELLFMTACNSNTKIDGGRVWIPEFVFTGTGKNRSLCLSYAVQQILTAEKMFSGIKYTADAYFPRYRDVMGLSDESGVMPISYEQFDRIWSTLKSELLALPGVSEENITFSKGKGKNLNRNLPLSQALLSHENLVRIYNNCTNINSYSDNRLILEVQRNKNILLKDAQAKIFNRFIRNALIDQIRSFAGTFNNETSIKIKRKSKDKIDPSCFELFRNFQGWEDYLQLGLRDKCSGEIAVVLEKYFSDNNILLLTKGLAGEFNGSDLPASIGPGEKFVVCFPIYRESFIYSNLTDDIDKSLIKKLKYPEAIIPETCTLFYCTPSLEEGTELIIGNTGLFAENKSVSKKLTFAGGISLNSRTNDFLVGYPPTILKFAGISLPGDEELSVNFESISADDFLRLLKKQKNEFRYLIKFSDYETTLNLISCRRSIKNYNIGFELIGNRVSPVSTYDLEGSESYFKHNCFYGVDKLSFFIEKRDVREINYLEFLLPSECYIPLRRKQLKEIIRKLPEIVPESRVEIIKNKILTNNTVPSSIYRKIKWLWS